MKQKLRRAVASILAIVMFACMLPFSALAAPASDIPSDMLDSSLLRALAYTGYDVQAQKNNGTIFQTGYYGSKTPTAILSNIGYGETPTGYETVTNSSTATGKAPNIACFEKRGLVCASFVTYVLCNYLPNIEGKDTQFITDAMSGLNSKSTGAWQTGLDKLVAAGKAEKIGTSSSNVNRSKLDIGDVIIFGNGTISHVHIGLFAGRYNGYDFFIHVGNDRGPEIQRVDLMAQAGDKSSWPTAYYHIPYVFEDEGYIAVNKKDTAGNPLAGAMFLATKSDGTRMYNIGPTDANGFAKVANPIPFGTYTVKETVFPTGYQAYGQSSWTVTLNKDTPNATVTINAVNQRIPGAVKIVKKAIDGKVSGITFRVTGNGVDKTVTTGSDGTISIPNLQPGTYTVTEDTPSQYAPTNPKTVTVTSGQTATVTFYNTYPNGNLTILKTSEDGVVAGITFRVEFMGTVAEFTTDENGIITIQDAMSGKYTITEVVDDRYVLQKPQTVTAVVGQTATVNFHNVLRRGDLEIIKTAEDGKVSGVVFTVKGDNFERNVATDESGKVLIEDLLPGKYTVTELAIDRYEPQEPQEVTVEYDKTATVTFHNTLKRGDLTVTKTAEDGLTEGATFRLTGTALSGAAVDEYATVGEDGKAIFEDILIGEGYTLQEVDVPDRYVVPTAQAVNIAWNSVTTATVENVLKKWTATVTKQDAATGTAHPETTLAGAVYGVYRDGTLQDRYTTDAAGKFTTKEYVCGEGWTIKEITPSVGYQLDPTVYPVGVAPTQYTVEHNTIELTVTEQVITGHITISKTLDVGYQQTPTPESGAVFEVYRKASGSYAAAGDEERALLTTDAMGAATSKALPYGVYVVHQTAGAAGHKLAPDTEVTIAEHGKVYTVVLHNPAHTAQVKIIKQDSETGKTIPVAGFGFKVTETATGETVTFTVDGVGEVSEFFTTADGTLMLPAPLPYGEYALIETVVPAGAGYLLDTTPVAFRVDEDGATVEVVKKNAPQKGSIALEKWGEVFASVTEAGGTRTPSISRSGSRAGGTRTP